METKQPTEEQIKELWEWCGFKRVPKYGGTDLADWLWLYPEGRHASELPYIDPNNLFLYVVPKLNSQGKTIVLSQWVEEQTFSCLIVTKGNPNASACSEYSKDPALALFWAIWATIK